MADIHRLSQIDEEQRTAVCSECGPVRVKPRTPKRRNFRCVRAYRNQPSQRNYLKPYRQYRRALKDTCEMCGFVATSRAQLDIDHKDGNHSNDDPANLQTLCANCHRLKTLAERRGPQQRKVTAHTAL